MEVDLLWPLMSAGRSPVRCFGMWHSGGCDWDFGHVSATTDQFVRSDFEIWVMSVLSKMFRTLKLKEGRKMQLVALELVASVSV